MRRPSSIEPFTPSSTVTLHPLLQAALDNLDVKVEEELSRYRRQRRYPDRTTPRTNPRPIARSTARPPLSLPITDSSETALGILDSNIQRSAPRASLYETQPQPSKPDWQSAETQWPQARSPQPGAPSAPTYSSSYAATQIQSAEQPTQLQPDTEVEPTHSISSYAEYADLSAYAPNATLQKLMQHPDQTVPPSEYLASSEELLRSIAEEEPELRAEREPNALLDTLLTPLGLGSMLLLLLSSTMLGYVVMNPSSIGLGTATSQSPSAPSEAATSDQTTADRTTNPSPDLSSQEFKDLDLDTLSTLPKKSAVSKPATTTKPNSTQKSTANSGRSTPTTSAAPASGTASGESGSVAAPAAQPRLSTVVVPAAPPVVPVPEPAIAPPKPAPVAPEPISAAPPEPEPIEPTVTESTTAAVSAPSPTRSPSYYVVTDYSGDPSLQHARDVVPDAYVRNLPSEGAKVQLGAFSDEAKAQELQQELQQQGIEAEIYQP